jgi:hypothetical protein
MAIDAFDPDSDTAASAAYSPPSITGLAASPGTEVEPMWCRCAAPPGRAPHASASLALGTTKATRLRKAPRALGR